MCALVRLTSLRPEAAPAAFEALSVAVHDPRALSTRSFPPLLETCLHFVERYRAPSPDLALRFLEMVEALLVWLVGPAGPARGHAGGEGAGGGAGGGAGPGAAPGDNLATTTPGDAVAAAAATAVAAATATAATPAEAPAAARVLELWQPGVAALAGGAARDPGSPALRDACLLALQRVLLASPPSVHDAGAWAGALGTLVLPLVASARREAAEGPKRGRPGAARSLRLAAAMLVKVLLAVVEILAAGPGFYALWSDSLSVLAVSLRDGGGHWLGGLGGRIDDRCGAVPALSPNPSSDPTQPIPKTRSNPSDSRSA